MKTVSAWGFAAFTPTEMWNHPHCEVREYKSLLVKGTCEQEPHKPRHPRCMTEMNSLGKDARHGHRVVCLNGDRSDDRGNVRSLRGVFTMESSWAIISAREPPDLAVVGQVLFGRPATWQC
jgi:hypothetical protein